MPKAPKAKVGQNKKPIHPNSRKAMALARNLSHDKRLKKSMSERNSKLDILVDKMRWFQTELKTGIEINTKAELAELVEKYFLRFEKELEQIQIINTIGNRRGTRHASRESSIKMTLDMEKSQFNANGFDVPDLTDSNNCDILKDWDGHYNYLPKIKIVKISVNDLSKNKQNSASSDNKTVKSKKEVAVAKEEEEENIELDENDEEELLKDSDDDTDMMEKDDC